MSSEPSELDRQIQYAAELSQKIVDALKVVSKEKSNKSLEEFDSIIEKNEKEEQERILQAEIKNRERKNEIRKKWKRY
jgi:hypothetical protein